MYEVNVNLSQNLQQAYQFYIEKFDKEKDAPVINLSSFSDLKAMKRELGSVSQSLRPITRDDLSKLSPRERIKVVQQIYKIQALIESSVLSMSSLEEKDSEKLIKKFEKEKHFCLEHLSILLQPNVRSEPLPLKKNRIATQSLPLQSSLINENYELMKAQLNRIESFLTLYVNEEGRPFLYTPTTERQRNEPMRRPEIKVSPGEYRDASFPVEKIIAMFNDLMRSKNSDPERLRIINEEKFNELTPQEKKELVNQMQRIKKLIRCSFLSENQTILKNFGKNFNSFKECLLSHLAYMQGKYARELDLKDINALPERVEAIKSGLISLKNGGEIDPGEINRYKNRLELCSNELNCYLDSFFNERFLLNEISRSIGEVDWLIKQMSS